MMLANAEEMIPGEHPPRKIKRLADACLVRMNATLNAMYEDEGRDSIPPERLLKCQLLMALYSVRSERQMCEQLRYNMLFRWFVDLNMDEQVFHPTTFTKSRDRLLEHEVAHELFAEVVKVAKKNRLMSEEHFSVDGR
jgi:transposase